jgi:hypothetical protein
MRPLALFIKEIIEYKYYHHLSQFATLIVWAYMSYCGVIIRNGLRP